MAELDLPREFSAKYGVHSRRAKLFGSFRSFLAEIAAFFLFIP